jgi:hypothetical protein
MTTDHRPFYLPFLLLALLLITSLPLFLCMPPIDDGVLFDLHTREILKGEVPYRGVLETNPPAMLWILAGTRWLLGDSSIALRAVDLAIFTAIVLLALAVLKQSGISRRERAWSAVVCYFYYFSLSEWCHCQRDMWLLAPSLALVWLRGRQIQRLNSGSSSRGLLVGHAMVEGLVLGAGMWLKPMLLVPAGVTWLVGVFGTRSWRSVGLDFLGAVLGVAMAGAGGVIWLVATGAWPYFLETYLSWNPHYVAAGRQHWTLARFLGTVVRLFPWYLLHVPAAALAVVAVGKTPVRGRGAEPHSEPAGQLGELPVALLAGFYVGWLIQAFLLQHLFDYVQAPGVLLALLICLAVVWRKGTARRVLAALLIVLVFVAVACSPAFRGSRLACWWPCLRDGSTPEIRDRLKLLSLPDWQDLDRVADYLREQQVADSELLCFTNSTIHLYWELGIRPATRYVYLENNLVFFSERTEQLASEIAAAGPRYVVSDLMAAGVPRESLDSIRQGARLRPAAGDERGPILPWSHPIVFRAGRYAVHRVQGPTGWPTLTVVE